jgi:hypothetical protein
MSAVPTTSIQDELIKMLDGSHAHASFEAAVADFPVHLRGEVPAGTVPSAWQLLEHIRLAQHDILTFSDNADGTYKHLKWPADYWPKDPIPPSERAWDDAVSAVLKDRASFEALIRKSDEVALVKPFPWGDGQTLFREAILIIDHAGYHVGEIVLLRRLLGIWNPS